ncbi:MAG: DUF6728 family protein [Bacteroidota bacterium]
MQEEKKNKREEKGLGYYFGFKEVFTYFFRKKDPDNKPNFSLKAMHTINKISIVMFLVGVIFFIFKLYVLR